MIISIGVVKMNRIEDLIVRRMTFDDIDTVVEIEKKSFKTPWPREAFISELENNSCSLYMVVEYNGTIVAYGGMWCILDEGHITNIATDPTYRDRGIGALLVKAMLEEGDKKGIKSFTLEVRVNNTKAIRLYERFGFEGCGVRKGYYQDTGEDALIMWKQ